MNNTAFYRGILAELNKTAQVPLPAPAPAPQKKKTNWALPLGIGAGALGLGALGAGMYFGNKSAPAPTPTPPPSFPDPKSWGERGSDNINTAAEIGMGGGTGAWATELAANKVGLPGAGKFLGQASHRLWRGVGGAQGAQNIWEALPGNGIHYGNSGLENAAVSTTQGVGGALDLAANAIPKPWLAKGLTAAAEGMGSVVGEGAGLRAAGALVPGAQVATAVGTAAQIALDQAGDAADRNSGRLSDVMHETYNTQAEMQSPDPNDRVTGFWNARHMLTNPEAQAEIKDVQYPSNWARLGYDTKSGYLHRLWNLGRTAVGQMPASGNQAPALTTGLNKIQNTYQTYMDRLRSEGYKGE